MSKPLFFFVLFLSVLLVLPISSSSSIITSLSKGSSLCTSQDTVISSPNGDYTAGFHAVGENAYIFAIWISNTFGDDKNYTIVWMANRDEPVNGRHSKLSLLKSGNLVLTDAGQRTVWSTETKSNAAVELELLENGNLVLTASHDKTINIWQSFDTPTDTLVPGQALTKNSKLVSLRSSTNYSSGFYKLHFSDDNVLQLVYEGLEMSSVYWPSPWKTNRDNGRSTYNNSKIAVLDLLGNFKSTDNFEANTSDFGEGIKRRLTLDIDGNIRVYSLNKQRTNWEVSWQAFSQPCRIHGICGLNSLCIYSQNSGRKCTCLQNHKMKNLTDWSYGCEPDFKLSCDSNMVDFHQLRQVEYVGYDVKKISNYTLEQCKEDCSNNCICKGFQFKYNEKNGTYSCFPKTLLFNGYRSPSWKDTIYIKVPKAGRNSDEERPTDDMLQCQRHEVLLERTYERKEQHGWLKTYIGFIAALGVFEFIFLASYLITTLKCSNATSDQVYIPVVNRFKRFTYAELKRATSNFRDEIGQGSGGVVYKGKLSDNRIAAIKCLKLEANQGEAEFLAECSEEDKDARPTMSQVVDILQELRENI
ncbi:hypothetical protein K7X08_020834 [Anisodus acutangulus]|uniref:Uncharacterized protein n=1 Tax=Anisodus acutangulus TaxID=402998 RepID=A0A9Q1MZ85_9SOLA|nr:hypothetical protein K7X08_020834 [Anisodus acutangulus]